MNFQSFLLKLFDDCETLVNPLHKGLASGQLSPTNKLTSNTLQELITKHKIIEEFVPIHHQLQLRRNLGPFQSLRLQKEG